MDREIVLMDFDGVIADTFGIAFAINKKICPKMTVEDYRRRHEGNIHDWDKTKYGCSELCHHEIDFYAEYNPAMLEAFPFPGMCAAVKKMAERYAVYIISSSDTAVIKEYLAKNGILECFADVLGYDLGVSKAEKIEMVLERTGRDPDECVMITDTLGDIREAASVGVGSIAVPWGYCLPQVLEKGNPSRILERPSQLVGTVVHYFIYKYE